MLLMGVDAVDQDASQARFGAVGIGQHEIVQNFFVRYTGICQVALPVGVLDVPQKEIDVGNGDNIHSVSAKPQVSNTVESPHSLQA